MDLVVFENIVDSEECIVAPRCDFDSVFNAYFTEADRNLEDYDVFVVDGAEGFCITTRLQTLRDCDRRDVVVEKDGSATVIESGEQRQVDINTV